MLRLIRSFVLLPLVSGGAVVALSTGAQAVTLVNGGFEQPVGADSATISNCPTCYIPENEVPGWETTDSTNTIEVWVGTVGIFAPYQGNQFAELNSFQAATLFQDVAGIAAGSLVGYELAHRGRNGVDTMQLDIIDLGTDNAFGGAGGAADTRLFTRQFSDGNTAWGFYSQGNVAAALGNTIRFAYSAVTSAGGDPAVGNFLDAASFGVGVGDVSVPAPLPVLGAGAAFGFSRRLRRRIRLSA